MADGNLHDLCPEDSAAWSEAADMAALDEANERMGAALAWIKHHHPLVYAAAVAAVYAAAVAEQYDGNEGA